MWNNTLDDSAVKWFVNFGTELVKIIDKIGLLRVALAALIMYFTKKYDINLAKLIFGPKDVNIIFKGLTKIKDILSKIVTTFSGQGKQELLALPAPGLPAPKETKLLPPGPDGTGTGTGLVAVNNQMDILKEKENEVFDNTKHKNFFANMLQNAKFTIQNIFKWFSSMFNKLRSLASNTFANAPKTIKTKFGTITNSIRKSYYNATNKAYFTDESGKVQRAEVKDTRLTTASASEKSYSKINETISKIRINLSNTIRNGKSMFDEFIWNVSASFNRLKTNISQTFSNIFNNIRNSVSSGFHKTINSIASAFNKIKFSRKNQEPQTTKYDSEQQSRNQNKVKDEFSRIWKQHIINVKNSVNTVKEEMSTIWKHHNERLDASLNGAAESFKKFKAKASQSLSGISNAAKVASASIKTSFSKVTSKAFSKVTNIARTTATNIKNAFSKITAPFAKIFKGFVNISKAAMNKIKATANNTANAFKQKLGYTNKAGSTNNMGATSWMDVQLPQKQLTMPDDAASKIDEINNAMSNGQVALDKYMSGLKGSDDALKAYVASLNGGKATLPGFNNFLKQTNASVKASGLAARFGAVGFTILNAALSMGLSMLIQFAIEGLMKVIEYLKDVINPADKLAKDLDNLNSEIDDVKSTLDSLNSELETTQDRMAELLAMDSLSFTEEEELKNLKLKNAELERQIELKEILLKDKEEDRKSKAKQDIDNTWNNKSNGTQDYTIDNDGVISHDNFWTIGYSGKDVLDKGMAEYTKRKTWLDNAYFAKTEFQAQGKTWKDYTKYLEEQYGSEWRHQINNNLTDRNRRWDEVDRFIKEDEEKLQKQQSGIYMVLTDMQNKISEYNLSYSMGDEDINKFLDEYYAYSIKFQNIKGAASKSSVISAIFDQTASDAIKGLKEDLDGIADSDLDRAEKAKRASEIIDKALKDETGAYERLQTFMGTVGVTADELADYFVAASEAPDITTIEGVTEVYQDAIDILGKYKDARDTILGEDEEGKAITWNNLFTEKDGKFVADKLKVASILEGSDEEIQNEFIKIAEDIKNGAGDVNQVVDTAIQKLKFSGLRKVLDIEIKGLSEANLDIFPDLKEDIDGIIDSFEELSKAVGGTVDALDMLEQARAEEEYSGSVSIETLENLMKYTDDYSKIISVDETGAIHLATDAEDILIETRLEKIKQDAKAALSEAELAYQEALHTQQTVTETGPAQEVLRGVINEVGGAIAFVTSLWNDLTSGNWAGSWERASQARESAIVKNQSAYANQEKDIAESVAAAAKNLKEAQDNYKIANSLTKDNVKKKHSSDEASGGNSTREEVEEDRFQKAMDYYENRLAANQARYDQVQNEIDLLEKQGRMAGEEYYQEQIKLENQRLSLLEQQKAEAQEYLSKFDEGSEEWFRQKPAY